MPWTEERVRETIELYMTHPRALARTLKAISKGLNDAAVVEIDGDDLIVYGTRKVWVDPQPPTDNPSMFDLLTEQSEWWRTNAGKYLLVTKMDIDHVNNLIGWFEKHVARILSAQIAYENAWTWTAAGQGAPDDVIAEVDGRIVQLEGAKKNPLTWLAKQPLFKALLIERSQRG